MSDTGARHDTETVIHAGEARELVPDGALQEGLRSVLAPGGGLELVSRQPNPRTSSCPSEIVRVRIGGRGHAPLFCKYGRNARGAVPTHRHGVAYEAEVHRRVLVPLQAAVPAFYGMFPAGPATTCIVTDALVSAQWVSKLGSRGLVAAACWIARFHAGAAELAASPEVAFATRYDAAHIASWLDCARAAATTRPPAWLPELLRVFAPAAESLCDGDATIVHGEFYPANILASAGGIQPVDWESAGFGPGALDVASLTMGWPQPVREECIEAYARERWPSGAPAAFRAHLDAARLYLCLRMLGDNRKARARRRARTPFFDYLHRTAIRCGFLEDTGGG